MKTTDLMVGDWVAITEPDDYHGYIGKVKIINNETGYITVFIKDGHLHDVLIDDLQPIPITQGILRDMGFEMKCWSALTNPHLELVGPDDEYIIRAHLNGHHGLLYEFYKYDCVIACMTKQIEHVHDLQNALFNCGIDKEIVL
jgi:hypothetical protein